MHLFIVNERTLPLHLQYQFAGVTIPQSCSWSRVTLPGNAENTLAALYADVCRVRPGDELLFYLERPRGDRGREGGRFFGIFEVASEPFYDEEGSYLREELGLPLVYRVRIRPRRPYQAGLTEWVLMDEMSGFRAITDIPWTLIYRKMEGGRGCTPLLPHEAHTIRRMLDLHNAGQRLPVGPVRYDPEGTRLLPAQGASRYEGAQGREQVGHRLRELMALPRSRARQWEGHLQAYLMQELGRNPALTAQLFPGVELTWIGNEIYVGAGLQRIDILAFTRSEQNEFVHLLELKSVPADAGAAGQINRYIKWLRAHVPDLSVRQVVPTIVAPAVQPGFHEELRIYLLGHGLGEYRVARVLPDLTFACERFFV